MHNFYVLTNVNRDLKDYVRGDILSLDPSSKDAADLLDAEAIQADPIADMPVVAAPEVQEAAAVAQPAVGGEATVTGEPSIDGQPDAAPAGDAQDITPDVSEKMTRDELEAAAKDQGHDQAVVEAAPNKAALVDLITNGPATVAAPENDPSANL